MKGNKHFKVLSIIFWCILILSSTLITNFKSESNFIQYSISLVYLSILVLAILFSVKYKKSKKIAKNKIVDDNIIEGRKIYKTLLRKTLNRGLIKFTITLAIIMIFPLINAIIHEDTSSIITFVSLSVLISFTSIFTLYFTIKFFYFPYKEFDYNGETFVMFVSRDNIFGRRYNPTFHVIHNCKEHTSSSRSRWLERCRTDTWLELLDDIIFTTIYDLNSWFQNEKFTNYIRIDIKSKQGKIIQCLYKIGTRKFLATKNLDKLPGYYEISRSEYLENKNKNKQKK